MLPESMSMALVAPRTRTSTFARAWPTVPAAWLFASRKWASPSFGYATLQILELLSYFTDFLMNAGATTLAGFQFLSGVEEVIGREKWALNSGTDEIAVCCGNARVQTVAKLVLILCCPCAADGRDVQSRRHIPLALAWSLSIHKSQGMTLDCLEVSLSRVFAQYEEGEPRGPPTSVSSLTLGGHADLHCCGCVVGKRMSLSRGLGPPGACACWTLTATRSAPTTLSVASIR